MWYLPLPLYNGQEEIGVMLPALPGMGKHEWSQHYPIPLLILASVVSANTPLHPGWCWQVQVDMAFSHTQSRISTLVQTGHSSKTWLKPAGMCIFPLLRPLHFLPILLKPAGTHEPHGECPFFTWPWWTGISELQRTIAFRKTVLGRAIPPRPCTENRLKHTHPLSV